ncbi:hypothetical protein AJ80_07715 [Polytolypa hystricis UAMH7299]|uniref:Uncharacterized protein n=1 Tax=Polytolypa hystricis (strain UAMH7299) TaxID=1447883 RepID=A0A2B7XKU7_POLH7|nr:hypothetical protein AJ80_07715 [Polytolypa hystricis UAMH7299]
MDPLTIVGLVSNIGQFIDFSGNLVSKSVELYRSADGVLLENTEIEATVNHLVYLNNNIQASATSTGDQEFQKISSSCETIAKRLLEALDKVKVKGKRTRWKSTRKALRGVWSKDEITNLEHRLANVRGQLNLHITAHLSDQFSQLSLGQSKAIGTFEAKVIDAITKQQDVLEAVPNTQLDLIRDLQKQTTDDSESTSPDPVQEGSAATSSSSESQNQSLKRISTLPLHRDDDFVGQEGIIVEIDNRLSHKSRVAIAGVGGVGFQEKNPEASVFWVPASNPARFQEAYAATARKLGLIGLDQSDVSSLKLIHEWLEDERHGVWLMVVDNADDMETFYTATQDTKSLSAYVPRSPTGKILVTTRDTRVGERLTNREKCMMVRFLPKDDAAKLLGLKLAGVEGWTEDEGYQLVENLDCLPLAITQATAFIRENHCSLSEYLEALQASEEDLIDLLSEDTPDPRRDTEASSSVARTWKVSFDLIQKRNPRAAEMLSLTAMFDMQGIPKALLRGPCERMIDFTTALGVLLSFSLLEAEKGGEAFVMHRLVQLCMMNWLDTKSLKQKYQGKALRIVTQAFREASLGTWRSCEILLPHARKSLRYVGLNKGHRLAHAKLCYTLSKYDPRGRNYDNALEEVSMAWETRQAILGDSDLLTIDALEWKGEVLAWLGYYDEGEAICRKVMQGREKVLGRYDAGVIWSMGALVLALRKGRKYDEVATIAQQAYERAKDARKEQGGSIRGDDGSWFVWLAMVLAAQHKFKEAGKIFQKVLSFARHTYPQEHPEVLRSMLYLAELRVQQVKFREAEELIQEIQCLLSKNRSKNLDSLQKWLMNIKQNMEQHQKGGEEHAKEQGNSKQSRKLVILMTPQKRNKPTTMDLRCKDTIAKVPTTHTGRDHWPLSSIFQHFGDRRQASPFPPANDA